MENIAGFDRKIIFADGYSVSINADRLTVQSGTRRIACDPLFLDEVEEDSMLIWNDGSRLTYCRTAQRKP